MEERIRELERENAFLRARIAELEEVIRELKNRNSKNSSTPPSRDWKSNSAGPQGNSGARKGHVARQRVLIESVDKTVLCKTDRCLRCKEKLVEEVGPLKPHQVVEVSPEGGRQVTNYVRYRYRCDKCHRKFSTSLPEGVSSSPFGARLQAMIATMAIDYYTSHRNIVSMLSSFFSIKIAVGSVTKVLVRAGKAASSAYHEIQEAIQTTTDPIHIDEPGWRQCGKHKYVWVYCTKDLGLISIRASRARREFEAILGKNPQQAIVTDRHSAYMATSGAHQFCLCHILRNCQRFAERKGQQRIVGTGLVDELKQIFKLWDQYRSGNLSLKLLKARTHYRRTKFCAWLEDGILLHAHKTLQRFCYRLYCESDYLWTYLRVPGMEPTNNQAERDLRFLVIKRKLSFGSWSYLGSVFIERLASIRLTLRKRGQNLLSYLSTAMRAHFSSSPAPSIFA